MKKSLCLLLIAMLPLTVNAECQEDRKGVVYCSKFSGGGAAEDRSGRVMCGVGECAEDSMGVVYCSSEKRGSVFEDRSGEVKCEGGCQRGTPQNCKRLD